MERPVNWSVPKITGSLSRYTRPPIIEAVLDLEVEFEQPVEISTIAEAVADEREVAPVYEVDDSGGWTGDTLIAERKVAGYLFKTEKGGNEGVVRYRTDRFSFSMLAPYTTWADFAGFAEIHWERYKKRFRPARVTAVGVRLVNRIVVGKESFDISDYLRTGVQISPYLSQIALAFFAQVQVPMHEEDCFATITTAADRSADAESNPALILDNDVTKRLDLSTSDPAFDDDFQAVLTMMERTTTEVFEACITDATRNLIS
jgi:uncharacterized protein (TIGR04255 family)